MVERHLFLVAISTLAAAAIGLPAGIIAAHRPRVGRPLLAVASIAQTVPSLALLGFLLPIPFIGGIGPRIAVVALILYALLPIVRSTAAGGFATSRSNAIVIGSKNFTEQVVLGELWRKRSSAAGYR